MSKDYIEAQITGALQKFVEAKNNLSTKKQLTVLREHFTGNIRKACGAIFCGYHHALVGALNYLENRGPLSELTSEVIADPLSGRDGAVERIKDVILKEQKEKRFYVSAYPAEAKFCTETIANIFFEKVISVAKESAPAAAKPRAAASPTLLTRERVPTLAELFEEDSTAAAAASDTHTPKKTESKSPKSSILKREWKPEEDAEIAASAEEGPDVVTSEQAVSSPKAGPLKKVRTAAASKS